MKGTRTPAPRRSRRYPYLKYSAWSSVIRTREFAWSSPGISGRFACRDGCVGLDYSGNLRSACALLLGVATAGSAIACGKNDAALAVPPGFCAPVSDALRLLRGRPFRRRETLRLHGRIRLRGRLHVHGRIPLRGRLHLRGRIRLRGSFRPRASFRRATRRIGPLHGTARRGTARRRRQGHRGAPRRGANGCPRYWRGVITLTAWGAYETP